MKTSHRLQSSHRKLAQISKAKIIKVYKEAPKILKPDASDYKDPFFSKPEEFKTHKINTASSPDFMINSNSDLKKKEPDLENKKIILNLKSG